MLENLDIVQMILIGLGIVIVGSVFLRSDNKKADPVAPPVEPSPVVPPPVVDKSHNFMCLVKKWHELKECAHQQDLHEVCKVLDKDVFPLLNQSEQHEVK